MSRIAWLALRADSHYRRDLFADGLRRVGYTVKHGAPVAPVRDDLLVIWNRYGTNHRAATEFERRGLPVIVAENSYLNGWVRGYFALSLWHHNGAGAWPEGDGDRWARLGIELKPWREPGGETILLPQRGIGPPGVAMPTGWISTHRKLGRLRPHPGVREAFTLEKDLQRASVAITWGSGAALKALALGVPVFYGMPRWIGSIAARRIEDMGAGRVRDDALRLAMFERMAWAQWSFYEIRDGTALDALLTLHRSKGG